MQLVRKYGDKCRATRKGTESDPGLLNRGANFLRGEGGIDVCGGGGEGGRELGWGGRIYPVALSIRTYRSEQTIRPRSDNADRGVWSGSILFKLIKQSEPFACFTTVVLIIYVHYDISDEVEDPYADRTYICNFGLHQH